MRYIHKNKHVEKSSVTKYAPEYYILKSKDLPNHFLLPFLMLELPSHYSFYRMTILRVLSPCIQSVKLSNCIKLNAVIQLSTASIVSVSFHGKCLPLIHCLDEKIHIKCIAIQSVTEIVCCRAGLYMLSITLIYDSRITNTNQSAGNTFNDICNVKYNQ